MTDGLLPMPTETMLAETTRCHRADRHKRVQPTRSRVSALNELHVSLAQHSNLYESESLQDQRDAVAGSLLAVVEYLQSVGLSAMTVAPLMRPVMALTERENNSIDGMFSERPRAGRPKTTLAKMERAGILAAVVNALLDANPNDELKLDARLNAASRTLKGRWFEGTTRAEIKSAREIVAQEASNHVAVQRYRMMEDWLRTAAAQFGKGQAIVLAIRMLNDHKIPFGGGEGGISKTPAVFPNEAD